MEKSSQKRKIIFDIVTIFPAIFDSYFSESIIKKAVEKKMVRFCITNLRDFTADKRRTVDDTPYGGGAGMILKVEPICKAVVSIKKKRKGKTSRVVIFSAKGKKFTQSDATRLSRYENLILICGRYEGVDERVAQNIADEEISVGDFVLTGGEIPAMILADSIMRLLPGVLGNPQSIVEESFSQGCGAEYPQYTKPAVFRGWRVPSVLKSGDHEKIRIWREKNRK